MAEPAQPNYFTSAFIASTFMAFFVITCLWRRRILDLKAKLRELDNSLKLVNEKCASERQGRIRAQQDLRKILAQPKYDNSVIMTSYPMSPIGIVRSCFSTRNGTPRQPLLVPLARASLVFNRSRVPPASLEGLGEYSHCWVIYVFHLNTDLDKLWRNPTRSKFKAKVRVPRLKGERIGVFSTRSPHRPCPIGLTIAKVESVEDSMIRLSGIDLVDGTPVLDVKPYLPYCDSIPGAILPGWLMDDNLLAVASVSFSEGFTSSLADCWEKVCKNSLYSSADEFRSLITQVLSWDIRSVSQRRDRTLELSSCPDNADSDDDHEGKEIFDGGSELSRVCSSSETIVYHLILEGLDVSYRIDGNSNVVVERISHSQSSNLKH